MTLSKVSNSLSSILSSNTKAVALDTTLQQSIVNFRELLQDIEQINIELESYKNKFTVQKEKCESKTCNSAEALKKDIACKDNVIQLVASSLTQLQETKNLNILNDIFKILCNETTEIPIVTSIKKENTYSENYKINMILSPKKELSKLNTPKKECSSAEMACKDDSVSEIEGTPTGRISPIIHSKISKTNGSVIPKASDLRDKKKCPDNWPTPDNKAMKLTFPPTPTRSKSTIRMRQGRLNVVVMKQNSVVDLTSSPEFAGGTRTCRSSSECNVQPIIKMESVESDDTILPSPTSGPTTFTLCRTESPIKFKKPLLSLKGKNERVSPTYTHNSENNPMEDITSMPETQNSIILNNLTTRFNSPKKRSPMKMEAPQDDDVTHCEIDSSMSLLRHVNLLEKKEQNKNNNNSPCKRPLEENINITNLQNGHDTESSMSLLRPEPKINKLADCVKRRIPEFVEPVYKEPTVRKKSEKRALKGWSCDECQNFYGELYKDDPIMLEKKIEECSKHRGRNNPARPKTPPGFWNPRKEVPESTEELNRLNNAD